MKFTPEQLCRAAEEIRDDTNGATRCVRAFLLEIADWLEVNADRGVVADAALDPPSRVAYAYLEGKRL